MSYAIQHVVFVVSNLFQKQDSKVIKPTKRLKSTIESTAKAASLFIYSNAISATFNTLVNQKYHSTLGSTWDFSATWSEPRPKLNPFHADFPLTSIIFVFCIWSKINNVSRKMTSDIIQHLQITNSTYHLRTGTAETSWEK